MIKNYSALCDIFRGNLRAKRRMNTASLAQSAFKMSPEMNERGQVRALRAKRIYNRRMHSVLHISV